jgi:hypothetical protein
VVAQWSASPLELQHSGMRFLIDENLSPVLADLARERGYEAMNVRDLGLVNAKDWTVLDIVRRDDWPAGFAWRVKLHQCRGCELRNLCNLHTLRTRSTP